MITLDFEIYSGVNEVVCRLNNLRRWTSLINQGYFNELSKQALNCLTTYIVASMEEHDGKEIQWERFPRIALYRAFKRAFVFYETVEFKLESILAESNIPMQEIDEATKRRIESCTNEEFAKYISQDLETSEERIFQASTKVATYLELIEMEESGLNGRKILAKKTEVLNSLKNYFDISAIRYLLTEGNEIFPILMDIAGLRNSNRWAGHAYITDCNVLGHLFDTAIFAYLISLENFKKQQEKIAAKFFFMGIFHDTAEAYTGDMPSDIKDAILNLRKATELFEDLQMQAHVYDKLPDFLTNKIKEVMFEEAANLKFKKLMKGADYLSADSECYRQYLAGSRDPYFLNSAIKGFERDLNKGIKACLTPEARKLHEFFLKYASDLFESKK